MDSELIIQVMNKYNQVEGFSGSSDGKESSCNAKDPGLIPGSEISPGEGNGRTLAWRIPWTEEPGKLQPMG